MWHVFSDGLVDGRQVTAALLHAAPTVTFRIVTTSSIVRRAASSRRQDGVALSAGRDLGEKVIIESSDLEEIRGDLIDAEFTSEAVDHLVGRAAKERARVLAALNPGA